VARAGRTAHPPRRLLAAPRPRDAPARRRARAGPLLPRLPGCAPRRRHPRRRDRRADGARRHHHRPVRRPPGARRRAGRDPLRPRAPRARARGDRADGDGRGDARDARLRGALLGERPPARPAAGREPRARHLYVLVGGSEAARTLARPVRGTLFLASEAADAEGRSGTVHGAIATGRRAARQVVRALSRPRPRSAP
jgi:hypothetical protein